MRELVSSTKAKQQHKWPESIGLQLRYITKNVGLPLPTPHIWMIVSDCDITVGPSAQGSVPATTLTWCYIRVRSRCLHPHTHTHTHISCEMGDLEPLLSFASLSFSQDNFLNYTCWWQRWRRRDNVLQELLLAAGGNEIRKGAWEGAWWSFPSRRKRKGIGRRKDRTPVPIPRSSDTMHKLIWEHISFSSSFASVCLGTLLGHRR